MSTVLVCDGEQRSALAVVRSLGRAGHRVFVCSHRPTAIAFGSRHAHGHARVPDPLASPAAYPEAIGELVSRWGAEIVIPVTDQSSAVLLSASDRRRGALIPGPDAATYARVTDKRTVLEEAAALGIATPRQVELERADDAGLVERHGLRYPVALKSTVSVRDGARHAAAYAEDPADLARALAQEPPGAFPLLVQERIVGPGTGIFLLVWDGETLATFAHRRVRELPPSGGASVCCESIAADSQLVAQSKALLDRVGWRGVAMVEFKIDAATGTPYLMEVNGRFWGSLQLAIDAGVDFPALLVAAAAGRPMRSPPPPYRTGVRLRWFWGDVDHLIARLRASPTALRLPPNAPTRSQVLADFFRWHAGQRWEVLRLEDPWPFARETLEWLAGRAGGRRRRITSGARALARSARRLPERALHRGRRRATLQRLARGPRPRSVLFVCYGNICRSPYAAAVARKRLPPDVTVGSAGFFGPDRPAAPDAVAVAAERGVDLTRHRSRLVTPELLGGADLVVVMEPQQRRRVLDQMPTLRSRVVLLGDLDPDRITQREVPDPFGQPAEVFRACFERIECCADTLAAACGGAPRDRPR